MLTSDEFSEQTSEVVKEVDSIESVAEIHADDNFNDEELPEPEKAPTPVKKMDNDTATVMHTSGTTGKPKGVVQTHRNIGSMMDGGKAIYRFSSSDSYLCSVPCFHVGGLYGSCFHLCSGGSIMVQKEWDAEDWAKRTEESEATWSFLVPAMIMDLINTKEATSYDTSSLRFVASGGSPIPESVMEKFEQLFDADTIFELYGQTECSGMSLTYEPDESWIPGSLGKTVPSVKAKVVDLNTGEEVGPGEEGELLFKGDIIAPEYWELPEINKEAYTEDGWFRSEDVVKKDENGYFYFVDRVDDIILSGGEKIAPSSVENSLQKMAEIKAVSIFGTEHERWGQTVTAAIIPSDKSLTEEDVKAFADEREDIADYEKPRRIIFVEEFPKTGSGKINKEELKKMVEKNI